MNLRSLEFLSEKYQSIVRNMKQKSYDFGRFYQDFFEDKRSEEELTKVATQSYWQSLRLNKRRLDETGIQKQVFIRDADKKQTVIDIKEFDDNGKNMVGAFQRAVTMEKTFVKNGKRLYRDKEHCLCLSHVIKASGEGDMAACPNCGNIGKISSYIDGCDYCNSKFSVDEFEEKISSFRLEEDANGKTRRLFKNIIKSALIVMVLLILLIIAFLACIIYMDVNDVSMEGNYTMYTSMVIMFAAQLVPKLFRLFIISLVLSGVFSVIYVKRSYARIKPNYVTDSLSEKLLEFVPEKFAQDLEYKLRNIHFAEHAREVNAFANINLTEAVAAYTDVLECELEKIEFLEEITKQNIVYLTVRAYLKLARYKDGKIREENEQVTMVLSGRQDMRYATSSAIQMYCCGNCGASVSLLEGGICGYCGEKLDYGKYSWIIESYYSNVSKEEAKRRTEPVYFGTQYYKDTFQKIKRRLAIIYVGLIVVGLGGILISNRELIYNCIHIDEYVDEIRNVYEELDTVDLITEAQLAEEPIIIGVERAYQYICEESIPDTINAYCAYLESEGYTSVYRNMEQVEYRKMIQLTTDYSVYHVITVYQEEGNLCVEYYIDEEEG